EGGRQAEGELAVLEVFLGEFAEVVLRWVVAGDRHLEGAGEAAALDHFDDRFALLGPRGPQREYLRVAVGRDHPAGSREVAEDAAGVPGRLDRADEAGRGVS